MSEKEKATERYMTKVEVPISILLETMFSSDNQDVENISRWVYKYGFCDFKKGKKYGKYGSYVLQKDYEKQSFYLCLDKEERKQYDYENYLLDEIDTLKEIYQKTCKHLYDIGNNELAEYLEAQISGNNVFQVDD